MTDAKQIFPLMVELIDETSGTEENPVVFTRRAREIIREIAAFSETTKEYAKNREKAESAVPEDIPPENLYLYILCLCNGNSFGLMEVLNSDDTLEIVGNIFGNPEKAEGLL